MIVEELNENHAEELLEDQYKKSKYSISIIIKD